MMTSARKMYSSLWAVTPRDLENPIDFVARLDLFFDQLHDIGHLDSWPPSEQISLLSRSLLHWPPLSPSWLPFGPIYLPEFYLI